MKEMLISTAKLTNTYTKGENQEDNQERAEVLPKDGAKIPLYCSVWLIFCSLSVTILPL